MIAGLLGSAELPVSLLQLAQVLHGDRWAKSLYRSSLLFSFSFCHITDRTFSGGGEVQIETEISVALQHNQIDWHSTWINSCSKSL